MAVLLVILSAHEMASLKEIVMGVPLAVVMAVLSVALLAYVTVLQSVRL